MASKEKETEAILRGGYGWLLHQDNVGFRENVEQRLKELSYEFEEDDSGEKVDE